MGIDIKAYHHTTLANAQSIMKNGFDPKYFKKIGNGFGVQCFKDKQEYPPYAGKEDCQIEVELLNCNLLTDEKIIRESQDKIRAIDDDKERMEIAKGEAERLLAMGYDAYTFKAANNRDAYVFLNPPTPKSFIMFKE